MKIFDIHSDLFTDIAWRRSRGETEVFDRIHYPKLKQGGVDSMICVIWVEPAFRKNALSRFQEVFHHVMADLSTSKHASICRTVDDMKTDSEKINIFLGIEGMSFLEEQKEGFSDTKIDNSFNELHNQGFRHAIFVWNEWNALASGTGAANAPAESGLTNLGKLAVEKAADLNWILDVSHLDEASFWDMYNTTDQPLMASHSNAYEVCAHERNLKDEQIKAIAGRGGLIGLNAFHGFVDENNPAIDSFIDHAVYISELIGPEYIAFGFDFIDYLAPYDLGVSFSAKSTSGLENVTKIPDLLDQMKKRGFSAKEIEDISFNNAFRFMKKHLRS